MSKTLTIRKLDDEVAQKLRERAARNQRSVEAEVREILRTAVLAGELPDFWALAEKVRAMTAGRPQTPAEILVREGRDER